MTCTIAELGLPPSPLGHTRPPKPDPQAHAKSARWIAHKFTGAIARGRRARAYWAGVPDQLLLDARRDLAQAIRSLNGNLPEHARQPLRDRALLIELADDAAKIRELLVEVAAVGLALEVTP